MSEYWNSRVCSITPYIPGEQPRDKTLIKLNTNENPYPPSPAVFEALQKIDINRLRLYPDPECTDLRNAIASIYGVRREEVFAGNGSDEILAFAFGAFFETPPCFQSGSVKSAENNKTAHTVMFPDITYSFYPVYAALWSLPYREIPLSANWHIKKRDYFEPSGGVIIANPNAPTGIAMQPEDILEIAAAQKHHNAVVIVDEAYSAFADASIVPFLSGGGHNNILSVHTFSKSYSLAGLRAGYAIGSANLIAALERIRDSFNSYTVDMLAQTAARAAVLDRDYFSMTCEKVIATRERISSRLNILGFEVLRSSANFIFIKHPLLSGADFFMRLRENGVLTRRFNKPRIQDFLRVTIGTDNDMDIFLELCSRSLNK